ncbi:hypothetical protein VNO77_03329 [Canavalia gladiata]|uniref:Uncharacterized protein n=1 Tax=Canavalia gladiata TaxID=3824 RepID=A0AAN9R3S2_CANGL
MRTLKWAYQVLNHIGWATFEPNVGLKWLGVALFIHNSPSMIGKDKGRSSLILGGHWRLTPGSSLATSHLHGLNGSKDLDTRRPGLRVPSESLVGADHPSLSIHNVPKCVALHGSSVVLGNHPDFLLCHGGSFVTLERTTSLPELSSGGATRRAMLIHMHIVERRCEGALHWNPAAPSSIDAIRQGRSRLCAGVPHHTKPLLSSRAIPATNDLPTDPTRALATHIRLVGSFCESESGASPLRDSRTSRTDRRAEEPRPALNCRSSMFEFDIKDLCKTRVWPHLDDLYIGRVLDSYGCMTCCSEIEQHNSGTWPENSSVPPVSDAILEVKMIFRSPFDRSTAKGSRAWSEVFARELELSRESPRV